MSFKHQQLVIEHSQTRGPGKAIMLVLAYRANDEGRCWPGLTRIARDSGLTRRTVTRCLPNIEATGELLIERRGRRGPTRGGEQASNLYRIIIAPPKGRDVQTPPLTPKVGTDSPKGRDLQSTKVGSHSPKGRDSLTPESSENDNMNRQGTVRGQTAGLSGYRIDYEKAEPPYIEDYTDIELCPDPILAAMAVTGERSKRAWGYWVKVLYQARQHWGPERADRLFKGCLRSLWGEMKADECDKPGAILNLKLRQVL